MIIKYLIEFVKGCVMKIKSITPAGIEPVYNMSVDEHHNYVIRGGIILKNCDALRYFCVMRTLGAQAPEEPPEQDYRSGTDYDEAMTGGEIDDGYMAYGGD